MRGVSSGKDDLHVSEMLFGISERDRVGDIWWKISTSANSSENRSTPRCQQRGSKSTGAQQEIHFASCNCFRRAGSFS